MSKKSMPEINLDKENARDKPHMFLFYLDITTSPMDEY